MVLKGLNVFRTCMLGSDPPYVVSEFGDRASEQVWFSQHPVLDHFERLHQIIPLLFHYGGAEAYTNQESHIWSVSSFFGSGCVFDEKFLTTVPLHHRIPSKELQDKAHDTLSKFISWSLEAGLAGKYLLLDFHGRPFGEAFPSFRRRGLDLPGGRRCTFGGFKSGRKALVGVHRFVHNYQSTWACERCHAIRPFNNAPLLHQFEDFTPNARWRSTCISHYDYIHLEGLSPWRQVRGWDLLLNYEDLMHNVLLGRGADAVTPACRDLLTWGVLAHEGSEGIDDCAIELRSWCSAHGVKYPSGMYTFSCLGLDSRGYLEMHSRVKAAHVRIMVRFVAYKVCDMHPLTFEGELCATTIWALSTFLHCLDTSGRWLTPDQQRSALRCGNLCPTKL